MLNKDFLMNEFQGIKNIEGHSVITLDLIEEIEINEDAKRVYVILKKHKQADFFELRIRDVIKSHDYDPEIEREL